MAKLASEPAARPGVVLVIARHSVLQSDLAGSMAPAHPSPGPVEHSLPRPPCFASLPSVEAMADWLGLPPERTLTTPAAGRLDEVEFAKVSHSFVPLQRTGPSQLKWTTVRDDFEPRPPVAVQTLLWKDFTLSQEAPLVLSSQLFRSRPTLNI